MVDSGRAAHSPATAKQVDWREVHGHLHHNARQRAALDANEAFWLREAERLQIWRPLGMVSILDYMERVLGHAPRTAQDRLRVARAPVSYTHLRAHETDSYLVCRLLLEK